MDIFKILTLFNFITLIFILFGKGITIVVQTSDQRRTPEKTVTDSQAAEEVGLLSVVDAGQHPISATKSYLTPEELAPKITKPPKPQGGFGSKV